VREAELVLSTIATVPGAFTTFRGRLELDPSYDQVIQDRHAAVRSVIERFLPSARTQLIGSLQRRTRIDPLTGLQGFDIDILVELDHFVRFVPSGGITPGDALNTVEASISSSLRYRKMGPQEDAPTITIPYTDGTKVEVVAAYRDRFPEHTPVGRAYWVPRAGSWVLADYDYDAKFISEMNAASGGRLIPAIKMLRAWRRHRAEALLRSWHLEVLAVASVPLVISYYEGRGMIPSWPRIIAGFFECAVADAQRATAIPGSLSEPPDYYLDPITRWMLTRELHAMAGATARARDGDDATAIAIWRDVFGKPFPGA
jgi:hypothetical protein